MSRNSKQGVDVASRAARWSSQMRKKVTGIAIVTAILIGICTYVLWDKLWSPKAAGVEALRAHLYDPDSLKLRKVRYFSETGATCGEANARNRMGGYVGFRRFVVDHDGKVFIESDSRASTSDLTEQLKEVQLQIAILQLMDARCPTKASASAR